MLTPIQGTFSRGIKSGLGVLEVGNGDVYEGQFENDKFHGQVSLSLCVRSLHCLEIFI